MAMEFDENPYKSPEYTEPIQWDWAGLALLLNAGSFFLNAYNAHHTVYTFIFWTSVIFGSINFFFVLEMFEKKMS
jgi:hypothetical protein